MANPRSQTPAELRWRLEDIYPDDARWEEEFTAAQARTAAIPALSGTLGQSSDALFAALTAQSALAFSLERLFTYARMRRDEDNGNALYQGMTERAAQLEASAMAAGAFFEPELLAIPPDTLLAWSREERFYPFRFQLRDLDRQRAHVLSAAEERILALAAEPLSGPDTIFTMLSDVDLSFGTIRKEDGEEAPLTHGSYGRFLESADRRVRREAYTGMYAGYRRVKNTVAAAYAASVKGDLFAAQARNFPGCAEAALFGGNVPLSVYEELIAAVHEALPDLRRYTDLRKRVLGLEELRMYDLYVPLVPEQSAAMTWEEAKTAVRDALRPLGDAYGALLERAFTEGWIDVCENDGKTSGAYSWGVYGTHPYVLLNFQSTKRYASTLAHELGHAMHSYHSDAALPYELAQYRIMVAEVASTVNESLMLQYRLDHCGDPREKAALLNQFLENLRTTCFRQTMFAEFELRTHRMAEAGEPLTQEGLTALYRQLNETYYPGVAVDDDIALEWMRIPHFYRAFYVYQYATGICAALALTRQILAEGPQRYLRFLSSGGSDYPIALLRDAGVDLTKPDAVRSALSLFGERLTELETLLA